MPLVPENVAQVVPGGTFPAGLTIVMPAEMPVPLTTDADVDPLVVVRLVATLPQMARLNHPNTENPPVGPTAVSVPLMTELA